MANCVRLFKPPWETVAIKLFKSTMSDQNHSLSIASLKPAIRAAMANGYSFLPKYRTNRFHRLQLLFWIKRWFRKENILDLKTSTDEFVSSNEVFLQAKGIC